MYLRLLWRSGEEGNRGIGEQAEREGRREKRVKWRNKVRGALVHGKKRTVHSVSKVISAPPEPPLFSVIYHLHSAFIRLEYR